MHVDASFPLGASVLGRDALNATNREAAFSRYPALVISAESALMLTPR